MTVAGWLTWDYRQASEVVAGSLVMFPHVPAVMGGRSRLVQEVQRIEGVEAPDGLDWSFGDRAERDTASGRLMVPDRATCYRCVRLVFEPEESDIPGGTCGFVIRFAHEPVWCLLPPASLLQRAFGPDVEVVPAIERLHDLGWSLSLVPCVAPAVPAVEVRLPPVGGQVPDWDTRCAFINGSPFYSWRCGLAEGHPGGHEPPGLEWREQCARVVHHEDLPPQSRSLLLDGAAGVRCRRFAGHKSDHMPWGEFDPSMPDGWRGE